MEKLIALLCGQCSGELLLVFQIEILPSKKRGHGRESVNTSCKRKLVCNFMMPQDDSPSVESVLSTVSYNRRDQGNQCSLFNRVDNERIFSLWCTESVAHA